MLKKAYRRSALPAAVLALSALLGGCVYDPYYGYYGYYGYPGAYYGYPAVYAAAPVTVGLGFGWGGYWHRGWRRW